MHICLIIYSEEQPKTRQLNGV